ncbi:MAG: hypothetical protein R2836_07600 [Chitinophagales bacterium]
MQLNATSLNAGADSYTWIFDNGDFSTNANASEFIPQEIIIVCIW